MKIYALSVLAVLGAACGSEATLDQPGEQAASIVMAGTVQANTKNVDVIVMAPRDNDNVIVTCTSLLSGNPADARYKVLKTASFAYPPADGTQSLTLADIAKQDSVIIYVDAKDARNTVIGEGCREGVEIKAGKTEDVQIVVYTAT